MDAAVCRCWCRREYSSSWSLTVFSVSCPRWLDSRLTNWITPRTNWSDGPPAIQPRSRPASRLGRRPLRRQRRPRPIVPAGRPTTSILEATPSTSWKTTTGTRHSTRPRESHYHFRSELIPRSRAAGEGHRQLQRRRHLGRETCGLVSTVQMTSRPASTTTTRVPSTPLQYNSWRVVYSMSSENRYQSVSRQKSGRNFSKCLFVFPISEKWAQHKLQYTVRWTRTDERFLGQCRWALISIVLINFLLAINIVNCGFSSYEKSCKSYIL